MPFVNAPNCLSLAANILVDNIPVQNTFHYRQAAPASATDLAACGNVYMNWWQSHLADYPTNVQLVSVYLRALDTANSPTFKENPIGSTTGTAAGEALPNNVTFSLTRWTGLAGRKMRGRIYWAALSDAWRDGDNTLASTVANNMVVHLEGLRIAMGAQAVPQQEIILHRLTGAHNDVLGYRFADLFLDSQRRRLPGHNIHH